MTPYEQARDLEKRQDELVSPAEYRRIMKALADDYEMLYKGICDGMNKLIAHQHAKSARPRL